VQDNRPDAGDLVAGSPEAMAAGAGGGRAAPAVTVFALCFNHARFLIDCLESIRSQTCQDFQLIVTDDCSTDDSAAMIEGWLQTHRPDAIFLRHRKNAGLCKTLNEALALSTGEYISMIATDDVWEPNKIEVQLAAMQAAGNAVAVVYSDAIQIDESGQRLPKDFIDHHRPNFAPPSGRIFARLAEANFIPAMATLIRRQAIAAVGGYDERLLFEDYDMWLRLAQRYDFHFLPGKVARYRVVATSMVRVSFKNNSPAYVHTMFLVREQMLETTLLDTAQRARQTELQWGHAYELYFMGDARATACLWTSARRTRRPRVLLLALLSACGVTRSRVQKLRALA
jgi:glycosyltransferase involved in cell wall biosynthesis